MKRMGYVVALLAFTTVTAGICAAMCTKELLAMYRDEPSEEEDYRMTEEELEMEQYCDSLELLAICTMAEAEGESEAGKRLVIDTVLNRVDHQDFPDNIWDVITEPGAFTSYENGRMDRVEPSQEIFRLVTEELNKRTNRKVLYFTAGDWPDYGTPLFREGSHYFAGE